MLVSRYVYNTYLIQVALGDPGDLSLMNAEGEVLTADLDSVPFSGQDLKGFCFCFRHQQNRTIEETLEV